MNAPLDIKKLLPAWQRFRSATDIGPVRDEAHYAHMTDVLNTLLQAIADDERHPAMELLNLVGDLIADYEAVHHPPVAVAPIDALRFLMEQHGLRQSDLPEIGSQGVVSEVLAGKREMNIRQIRALAKRFGVTPETFV